MGAMAPFAIPLAVNALQIGRQDNQQEAANQQAAAANQAIADQYERDAQKRRSLLDREMASARARLGAMGVGGAGGSAAAVIEGLQRRSDEDMAELRGDLESRSAKTSVRVASGASTPGASQIGLGILRPLIGGR